MKQNLARYAVFDKESLGRKHHESYDGYLGTFQRDRERIIHSVAFRRLEYKTQVFVNHTGDHYRTRLTHTLECAHIAKVLAQQLELNEDLAECIALCHDLGHPPFGHAGEQALNEVAKEFGGFDHNAQGLKIVTKLEKRYAEFDGLNLSWETLEGIAKHNGPLQGKFSKQLPLHKFYQELAGGLQLDQFPSLEAQVASLADDITYISHDLDDGLRAGFFTLQDVKHLGLLAEITSMLDVRYPTLEMPRMINEVIRRLVKYMVNDLLNESKKRIANMKLTDIKSVRQQSEFVIKFSHEMEQVTEQLKKFLFENVYRHYQVNRMAFKAKQVVRELFLRFMDQPNCLPSEWNRQTLTQSEAIKAEIIMDYVAGMTDRYAMEEYEAMK